MSPFWSLKCVVFFLKFSFWRWCWDGRWLLPFVDSAKVVCFYFFSLLTPSCDSTKSRMWKKPVKDRPCLPFRLQIAQLPQTSREPWIFHLASLRVQQPLAHLLLQKPTTFLLKADATYALALGCQWDGPLTVPKITAFWRLEWGHGIFPI